MIGDFLETACVFTLGVMAAVGLLLFWGIAGLFVFHIVQGWFA